MRNIFGGAFLFGVVISLQTAGSGIAQEAAPGGPLGLSPGMRAYTTEVKLAPVILEDLHLGVLIDIYMTHTVQPSPSLPEDMLPIIIADILIKNVRLLDIDRSSGYDIELPAITRTVRLESTVHGIYDLVQKDRNNTRTLTLALAGNIATAGCAECVVMTSQEYYGIVQIAEQKICTRRIRRGVDITVIAVPCPTEE